jgi:hypothetical protein
MSTVILPLNNNSIDFQPNYNAFLNCYALDKSTYIFGSAWAVEQYGANSSITAILSGNTIVFTPTIVNSIDAFWFTYNPTLGYVPQKWVESNLYQERDTDLNHKFIFKGNFNSITLDTSYSTLPADQYTIKAFIKAFDTGFNLLGASYSSGNTPGNFTISLDTAAYPTIAHLQWGFVLTGYPVYISEYGQQGSAIIGNEIPCFKEDTKILTEKGYVPIQDLRKGDLVKTINDGYKPIYMIGYKKHYHDVVNGNLKDKLYKCSHEQYPEVFEDLIITGGHSILIDNFKDDVQREQIKEFSGDIYVTDSKYRLPICLDEKASVYEKEGEHTIYHFALEHDNYYMNYGIYANGLLVETCSKRYMTEYANMTLQ